MNKLDKFYELGRSMVYCDNCKKIYSLAKDAIEEINKELDVSRAWNLLFVDRKQPKKEKPYKKFEYMQSKDIMNELITKCPYISDIYVASGMCVLYCKYYKGKTKKDKVKCSYEFENKRS